MKKKSFMLLLSASLVFSMLTPSMIYAEENEILVEESMETDGNDNDGEIMGAEKSEDNVAISIESIQSMELDVPATAEEQLAVQELAGAEENQWTDLADYNLRYRYKDNVLRVELLDESQPQKATNFGNTGAWTSGEAKTITKIEIGEGIVTIGRNWFSGTST